MLFRAFFLCTMLQLPARGATGQMLYSSIVGNVTDETNAAVPRATVKVVHLKAIRFGSSKRARSVDMSSRRSRPALILNQGVIASVFAGGW